VIAIYIIFVVIVKGFVSCQSFRKVATCDKTRFLSAIATLRFMTKVPDFLAQWHNQPEIVLGGQIF